MENNKTSKTYDENNYQIVLDEQTTTNNDHLKKLKEDDFEEQQLSSKFASLYSKLPDQQPLYQIYLLQEQQRINDSLEPIEEILNIGKKKNVVKKEGKGRRWG